MYILSIVNVYSDLFILLSLWVVDTDDGRHIVIANFDCVLLNITPDGHLCRWQITYMVLFNNTTYVYDNMLLICTIT